MRWPITVRRSQTPKIAPAEVVEENEWVWVVTCEGGCGKRMAVAKTYWYPADYTKPDGDHIEVNLTGPAARRCGPCGPFDPDLSQGPPMDPKLAQALRSRS